jgi:hypothetical protein
MKTLLIAALLIGPVGMAPPAAAAPGADCPDRHQTEDGKAYGARARDYCEVRWSQQLAKRQTAARTHDEFIDTCLRRCVAGQAGAPLDWILGGIWAGTLAYGLAAGGGGSGSPPASP